MTESTYNCNRDGGVIESPIVAFLGLYPDPYKIGEESPAEEENGCDCGAWGGITRA